MLRLDQLHLFALLLIRATYSLTIISPEFSMVGLGSGVFEELLFVSPCLTKFTRHTLHEFPAKIKKSLSTKIQHRTAKLDCFPSRTALPTRHLHHMRQPAVAPLRHNFLPKPYRPKGTVLNELVAPASRPGNQLI